MNKKHFFNELLYGKWFPVLLIIVMACAYMIQLPQIGFYIDDWVIVSAYNQGGESGVMAYGVNDSRPFYTLVFAKLFSLFGTGVLTWQLFSLFCRFGAALSSFFLLREIWPEHKLTAALVSLLFSISPYYRHQPIPVSYFMIMFSHFLIMMSFLCTVKALKTDNKILKILLFLISYITSLVQLACIEYYLSLEAVRLLVIYFVIKKRDGTSFGKSAKKAILVYIPYIAIILFILVYRFVYVSGLSDDARKIGILDGRKGFDVILHIISRFLQYLAESLVGFWYQSIDPEWIDLTVRNTQLALGMGLAVAAGMFLLIKKCAYNDAENNQINRSKGEMLILGLAAMLLGYLPGMMIDATPVIHSNYSDRYMMPSLWGGALFFITWFSMFVKSIQMRSVVYSGMFFLGVFFQIQNAYFYRYSWKNQQQFQWQLYWRAPDLAENTAVIGDSVIATLMGEWADGSMLFEMYGKENGIDPTPYWYFNIGEENYYGGIRFGEPVSIKTKIFNFKAAPQDVLIVSKQAYGRCLWVLDEADVDNPYLEGDIRSLIRYQNKARIIGDSGHTLSPEIFGKDYVHDWCYYFQKADLAFDMGNYEEAMRLYDEAATNNIGMGNPVEMRPFIKSAAFSGNWEKALDWTEMAYHADPARTYDYFENLWALLNRDLPDSDEKSEVVSKAFDLLAEAR